MKLEQFLDAMLLEATMDISKAREDKNLTALASRLLRLASQNQQSNIDLYTKEHGKHRIMLNPDYIEGKIQDITDYYIIKGFADRINAIVRQQIPLRQKDKELPGFIRELKRDYPGLDWSASHLPDLYSKVLQEEQTMSSLYFSYGSEVKKQLDLALKNLEKLGDTNNELIQSQNLEQNIIAAQER